MKKRFQKKNDRKANKNELPENSTKKDEKYNKKPDSEKTGKLSAEKSSKHKLLSFNTEDE